MKEIGAVFVAAIALFIGFVPWFIGWIAGTIFAATKDGFRIGNDF